MAVTGRIDSSCVASGAGSTYALCLGYREGDGCLPIAFDLDAYHAFSSSLVRRQAACDSCHNSGYIRNFDVSCICQAALTLLMYASRPGAACRACGAVRDYSRRGGRSVQRRWRSRSRGPVPEFRKARNRNRVSRVMLLERAPSACLEEQDS